jgi:hypothetical protein
LWADGRAFMGQNMGEEALHEQDMCWGLFGDRNRGWGRLAGVACSQAVVGATLICASGVSAWAVACRHGLCVTPGFKGQSRVRLIHAPKKTTYIITECIEINVTITSEYLLLSGSLITK